MNGEQSEGEHPELLGVRAYARHKGWAPSYVCKLAKQGRLVMKDDLIDVAATDKRLAETIIPLRRGVPKDAKSPRAKHRKALGSASVTFIEAKTKREWHEAQLAEIKHKKLLGSLLDAEDVKREDFAIARAIRDALLALPDRLALMVAAEGDARKVHEILSAEIEQALSGLAAKFAREAAESAGAADGIEPD